MMKKQEFVPREISEKPLYELKSVEDIPVSELYQVKINGKEQRVYHTEFFDFVSFLDENDLMLSPEISSRVTWQTLLTRMR